MLNFLVETPWLQLIMLVLVVVIAVMAINQHLKIKKIISRNKSLYGDEKAPTLEKAMTRLTDRARKNEKDIAEVQDIAMRLYELANVSLQKVGLVRFNPFGDTGGDQSFAIALLDRKGSGMIISSLHAREGTRIYAKPIVKGESKYPLTDEEKEAIVKALEPDDEKDEKDEKGSRGSKGAKGAKGSRGAEDAGTQNLEPKKKEKISQEV